MPPILPEVIGKYSIERFIESGGMGDVYLARDPSLDRPVAIKFLREGFDSQEMRERFEREARAAGRLSHPNIVTIYEFGEFAGRPFIAMEFVRGEPLSKLIRRREPIPLVRKLEMMEGLCSGLAHAHKTGLVHRDIKPANLMVDSDGGPLKILDFGIVRMAGSGLTSHGVLVGTVNYMSPEQITGRGTIDQRSDVFAVGAVLHEIFTYQRAFPGEMTDVLYKIVHAQPESAAVLVPDLDPGIVRAIDQCLQKAPELRYQDLGVLRRDLGRIRQRLEVDESDAHGHSVVTVRAPRDVPSHPSHPSGRGTPPPATPGSYPSVPSPPPLTPASERARRAAEIAAAEARARQEEEARLARERDEAERASREQAAREQAAREQAAREQAAREQAAREQAAREQAAREKAQREQAARERAAREQAARERAEAERAAAEQKAREEAARKVEVRRQQQQRDVVDARQLLVAGRFGDALERLRPWAEESAGDATFAGLVKQAEAGVARLEAERRAAEALARRVTDAGELVAKEEFGGASRIVQEILKGHPGHPGARHLEREIVRGVELQARAKGTVERARSLFDAHPGEALELLEGFAPPHALVDATLAELRERHAARERERLARERRERRAARLAAVTAQAGALARNRAVQGVAALLLVVAIVAASWGTLFPPTPDDGSEIENPSGGTTGKVEGGDGDATKGPVDIPAGGGDGGKVDPTQGGGTQGGGGVTGATGPGGTIDRPKTGNPQGGGVEQPVGPRGTKPGGETGSKGPVDVLPAGRGNEQQGNTGGGANRAGSGEPGAGTTTGANAGGETGGTPAGGGGNPAGAGGATGIDKRPEPTVDTRTTGGGDPKPPDPGPRETKTVTPPPPPPPTLAEIGEREILQWIKAYQAAYTQLDEATIRQMNPASSFSRSTIRRASVTFAEIDITVAADGQSAALHAFVTYQSEFVRGGRDPKPSRIVWNMRKIGGRWIANPGR